MHPASVVILNTPTNQLEARTPALMPSVDPEINNQYRHGMLNAQASSEFTNWTTWIVHYCTISTKCSETCNMNCELNR